MTTVTISTTSNRLIEAIKAVIALEPTPTEVTYDNELYDMDDAPSIKKVMAEIEKMPKHEQEALRAEVRAEMYGTSV